MKWNDEKWMWRSKEKSCVYVSLYAAAKNGSHANHGTLKWQFYTIVITTMSYSKHEDNIRRIAPVL